MFKRIYLVVLASVLSLFASASQAAPVDVSGLTGAVDMSSTNVAILAVAGILIGVYVAILATRFVIGMVKRGG